MKIKLSFCVFTFLLCFPFYGQELPSTLEYGPGGIAPSAAALFKFDDVPVSLYTGVPDVSIPLLSLPTRSKDIGLNITYSYHPGGSGWNISYGGSITRVIENSSSEFKTNELGFANNTRFASDVYKFNFMGHSGSFFLKKDANNMLVPSVLVNKGEYLKIEANFNPTTYFVNSFTVYDSKGYKFVFDVFDKTIKPLVGTPTVMTETRTSFRLSAIYDNNGKKLIGLTYTEKLKEEPGTGKKDYTNITAQIQSEGFGKVQFIYSPLYDGMKVDEITLLDLNSNVIRRADFREQDRLAFRDAAQNKMEEYRFYYSDGVYGSYDAEHGIHSSDKFGYPSFIPYHLYEDSDLAMDAYLNAAVNPQMITRGVLEKIGLPTGGSILYEYESNTYSFYQGYSISKNLFSGGTFTEDPDFYYNYDPYEITFPYNHIVDEIARGWIGNVAGFTLSGAQQPYYINVRPEKYYSEISNSWVYPNVTLSGNSMSVPHYRPYNLENFGYGRSFVLDPGHYFLTMGTGFETTPFSAYRTISTMRRNPAVKKWKYGGGRRIKRIGYFEADVRADLYRIGGPEAYPEYQPIKETYYSYNLFGEPNRSSGNLVADSYRNFSDKYGQLEFVGYSNVTVTESGNNGKTEYTFSTSADYPLEFIDMSVSASHSKDYKRGLLKNKKAYDKDNILVQNTDYGYLFFDESDQLNYFDDKVVRDRTGRSRLGSETTTQYFSNSTPVVQTTLFSYYDDLNRNIETKESTGSFGESLKTKYFYHTGNSTVSKNRISEVERTESYRNDQLLSTSKINYRDNWPGNLSYLSETVATSKGEAALQDRMKFNRYDQYSNPEELQQENGIPIVYLWGYHKTKLIAKIENLAYDSLPPATITNLENLSDSGSETNLIAALNALRTAHPGAIVTTYTHKPLIGPSTVTDPKGDRITYEYDSFNRLKRVKDKDGNTLTETNYNYRP